MSLEEQAQLLNRFLRGGLAWTILVAALWPFNVPLAALAYKIHRGPRPLGIERAELWTRSTFAALCVALATLAMLLVDFVLIRFAALPAGPIQLAGFLLYVPVAVWILFVFFALDDLLAGLGLFVIYVYLPAGVLFVLNWLMGVWDPLEQWPGSWLKGA
jgi:hypothetical protein